MDPFFEAIPAVKILTKDEFKKKSNAVEDDDEEDTSIYSVKN